MAIKKLRASGDVNAGQTPDGPAATIVYSDAAETFYLPIPLGCRVDDVITRITEAFDATTPSLKLGIAYLSAGNLANPTWSATDDDGFLTDANIKGAGWSTAATAAAPIIKRASTTGSANPYGNGFAHNLPESGSFRTSNLRQYAIMGTWDPGASGTTGRIDIFTKISPEVMLGVAPGIVNGATA